MYQAMAPMAKSMPEMMDGMISLPKFALLRFGEWDRILKEPKPPASQKVTTALWHYSRALAYAGRERQDERRRRTARHSRTPASSRAGCDVEPEQGRRPPGVRVRAARRTLGDDPVARLRRAVQMQDAFVYDEPPAWYYPVRETARRGAAARRPGRRSREGFSRRRPPQSEEWPDAVRPDGIPQSPKENRRGGVGAEREFDAAWSKADVKLKLDDLL